MTLETPHPSVNSYRKETHRQIPGSISGHSVGWLLRCKYTPVPPTDSNLDENRHRLVHRYLTTGSCETVFTWNASNLFALSDMQHFNLISPKIHMQAFTAGCDVNNTGNWWPMCSVSVLSRVFNSLDIAWLIHIGTRIYIKPYFLQVAHLSVSESASSGHLCRASGRVRGRQSCVFEQWCIHTYTHNKKHRMERGIVLLWVCVLFFLALGFNAIS